MNKEDILAKSREENKNMDLFEKEVLLKGNTWGCIAVASLGTIFFIAQIIAGGGINYALYALVFALPMASFWTKFIYLKKRHELIIAMLYSVFVLLLSVAHIYSLFSTITTL